MQSILHKPYIDQIIYRLTEARHYLNSNSNIITNHLIFNLAFKTFWKHYRIGRGCVYTFTTPFKECEVLSYLTGIIYWCFHRGIVIYNYPTTFHNSLKFVVISLDKLVYTFHNPPLPKVF